MPVGAPGTPYGVLHVSVSTATLRGWARLERQRAYVLALVAALLVAGAVAYLTSIWVGGPLSTLGAAMAGAHAGVASAPAAPELGPEEFRLLTRRYNGLREALTARQRESEARAALLALEERARSLDRLALLEETATGFAHEIGTPLNTVSGHLQLLRDDLKRAAQPAAVERVQLLLAQVDRLAAIVRTRLDRGGWPAPTLQADGPRRARAADAAVPRAVAAGGRRARRTSSPRPWRPVDRLLRSGAGGADPAQPAQERDRGARRRRQRRAPHRAPRPTAPGSTWPTRAPASRRSCSSSSSIPSSPPRARRAPGSGWP